MRRRNREKTRPSQSEQSAAQPANLHTYNDAYESLLQSIAMDTNSARSGLVVVVIAVSGAMANDNSRVCGAKEMGVIIS